MYFLHDQQMAPTKMLYTLVTLVISSLDSFFNVLFLKYVVKILVKFLAFLKGG